MVQSTSRGAKYPIKTVYHSPLSLFLSLFPIQEVITGNPACKFNSR